MVKLKNIWEIEVGDRIEVNGIAHDIVDTSYVCKPNPVLVGKADDGHLYDITGNMHGDTEFLILN
jgi:hypothetical protein